MSKKMNKRAQSKKKLNHLKKAIEARDRKSKEKKKTYYPFIIFWGIFTPFYLYLIYRLFELDNYLF